MTRSVVTDLLKIFTASYTAVLPNKIIRKCVSFDSKCEILAIGGDKFNLRSKNLYVVGAGKAVQYMAKEIYAILGPKIKRGIISIPKKSTICGADIVDSNIKYFEGAQNNLPDIDAQSTAKSIIELARNLNVDDFLLVLISGGGSALLPLPKEPITLDEKTNLIKKLANSGANIKELNTVRKKISGIKGGKLAIAASPARTVTLVLSDIVDDPLDLIASGPTVEDKEEVENTINIIKKYNLYQNLPTSIKQVLEQGTAVEAFPKDRVSNYVVGSNNLSVLAAHKEAQQLEYLPIFLSKTVTGNVKDLAKDYVKLVRAFSEYLNGKIDVSSLDFEVSRLNIPGVDKDFKQAITKEINPESKGICLILGGEPTVEVKGNGNGGRNQQLALEFSINIHNEKNHFKNYNVYILSAGTDGIDGPTDAAGAIGYLDLVSDSEEGNIDVHTYLENNDSYNFYKNFKEGSMHVITGHTHTNVMDIHLVIIERVGTLNRNEMSSVQCMKLV